ncbi:MAG: hypothetical protein LBS23_01180 [Holosporaceae bacterium]|jgi:hypothetical protein|nr:hypothetical protein [Holosporaceae bacterium]
MKIFCCICLFIFPYVFGDDDASNNTETKPKLFADISRSAQENAVSFDGMQALFGFNFAFQNFIASVGNSKNLTQNKMDAFGARVGVGYSKSFKKGLLVAINIVADVLKKSKKDGNWNVCNQEYENQRGAVYPGERTSHLETDVFSPNIALKCGYLFPGFQSVIFATISVAKISGTYSYKRDGANVCNVGVNAYIPSLGLGIWRKFNRQWGASLEADFALNKPKYKKTEDSVEHTTKFSHRININVVATFSITSH